MGVETDRAIARVASGQDGLVTSAELRGLGLSEEGVRVLKRNGRLHAVHRGVYHVGHAALSQRAKLRAALLAVGDEAVLSHRSAATVWGLMHWDGWPEVTTTARTGAKPKGLIVHRVRTPPQATGHQGFRITTPEQTILDLASIPLPQSQLARALGEAEYQRIIDRDRLKHLAAGRRGARAIREALGGHEAPTRSTLEEQFISLLRRADLPHPQTNARLNGRQVDFLWPRERVIVETDGWAAHGRREAFDDDRDRDLDHGARGYRTARITARNLRRKPLAQLVRVGALLLGGEQPPVGRLPAP